MDEVNAALAGEPAPASNWESLAVPLVQQFEGFEKDIGGGKVKSYRCPAGVWTIGYGSTGPGIGPDTVWTHEEADEHFRRHLAHFANGVEAAIGDVPTTDAQFAAMVSLAYNIGLGAFKRSTVLKRHKKGFYPEAAEAFLLWNKAGGRVLKGLTRRREAEKALYETT